MENPSKNHPENDSEINSPDPSRLIQGLRDTGYNFNSAAADVVDNSIAAGAANIHVRTVLKNDGTKIIYFGDDGHGMDEAGLKAAMRYGAAKRKDKNSLGKFGLGLKTASSSVCKKYSLISRNSPTAELNKKTWDLDYVNQENEWRMLDEPLQDEELLAFDELCGDTGTLLVWEKCDRILANNNYEPGSSDEKNALNRIAAKMEKHFELVFHKYLDPSESIDPFSDNCRTVNITVNEKPVEFWNPFYPKRAQQVLDKKYQRLDVSIPPDSDLNDEDQTFPIRVRAWVLPHRKDMDKAEEKQFAKITNKGQGFYIYREGRLIDHGGWQEIWNASEPHYSLIRVELDFNGNLDDAFEIDVRKSRIIMNASLVEYFEKLLTGPRDHANSAYRRKQKQDIIKGISHTGSAKTVTETKNIIKPSVTITDPDNQNVIISNNRGNGIKIQAPVLNEQDPKKLCISASEEIVSGHLWEANFSSESFENHQLGVHINKHHDFYSKIYSRAGNQYSIEGMDLLIYSLAAAEMNNTHEDLEEIWEDIRDEVSRNLKRLLKNYELPPESSSAE